MEKKQRKDLKAQIKNWLVAVVAVGFLFVFHIIINARHTWYHTLGEEITLALKYWGLIATFTFIFGVIMRELSGKVKVAIVSAVSLGYIGINLLMEPDAASRIQYLKDLRLFFALVVVMVIFSLICRHFGHPDEDE